MFWNLWWHIDTKDRMKCPEHVDIKNMYKRRKIYFSKHVSISIILSNYDIMINHWNQVEIFFALNIWIKKKSTKIIDLFSNEIYFMNNAVSRTSSARLKLKYFPNSWILQRITLWYYSFTRNNERIWGMQETRKVSTCKK